VAVAFRFSHPVSSSRPHPAFRAAGSRASSWQLNILHVSTFTSKILRAVAQPRSNRFIDLAGQPTDACAILIRFSQLNPALSRFCVQLLSIQRFCACLRAKLMIPKDQRRRVYAPVHGLQGPNLTPLTPLRSIFYQKLLSIQRFCSCSHANPMIPKDQGRRVYLFGVTRSQIRRGNG